MSSVAVARFGLSGRIWFLGVDSGLGSPPPACGRGRQLVLPAAGDEGARDWRLTVTMTRQDQIDARNCDALLRLAMRTVEVD